MITGLFCAVLCALTVGQVGIGPDRDQLGGVIVRENLPLFGLREVARYVDNEEPDQLGLAARERAAGWTVIAGVAPGSTVSVPNAINALEWYPFWGGRDHWGAPPASSAYILQRWFAWDVAPSQLQATSLLRAARRYHPSLVLFY